mgnify:CR=1 FL=1
MISRPARWARREQTRESSTTLISRGLRSAPPLWRSLGAHPSLPRPTIPLRQSLLAQDQQDLRIRLPGVRAGHPWRRPRADQPSRRRERKSDRFLRGLDDQRELRLGAPAFVRTGGVPGPDVLRAHPVPRGSSFPMAMAPSCPGSTSTSRWSMAATRSSARRTISAASAPMSRGSPAGWWRPRTDRCAITLRAARSTGALGARRAASSPNRHRADNTVAL